MLYEEWPRLLPGAGGPGALSEGRERRGGEREAHIQHHKRQTISVDSKRVPPQEHCAGEEKINRLWRTCAKPCNAAKCTLHTHTTENA